MALWSYAACYVRFSLCVTARVLELGLAALAAPHEHFKAKSSDSEKGKMQTRTPILKSSHHEVLYSLSLGQT